MKTILIYTNKSTFVKRDIEMLKCEEYHFKNSKKLFIFSIIKQFFYFLFHPYQKYIIWFCDYHAIIPVLFSKLYGKSIILVGGYDAMSLPELRYGIFYKNKRKALIAKISYLLCDKIWVVDKSLIEGYNSYTKVKTGVRNFMKIRKDKFEVVPFGYELYKPLDIPRNIDFLTVGNITDKRTFKRKGFYKFVEMAIQMPDKKFVIIGAKDLFLKRGFNGIYNLTVYKNVPINKVLRLMNESKVYCQFSKAEGLPNTLCEAMLMGCVPIGTKVNGIPRAIGKTGIVTNKITKEKMLKALSMNGEPARQRIMKKFPKGKRLKKLNSEL